MLQLRSFESPAKYFLFDETAGTIVREIDTVEYPAGRISTVTDEICAAVYRKGDKMFLQVNKDVFELNHEIALDVGYTAADAILRITSRENQLFELHYPNWHLTSENAFIPGHGVPADDDEDFFAYVSFIYTRPNSFQGLFEMWGRQAAGK
jgi:hypothetical protein